MVGLKFEFQASLASRRGSKKSRALLKGRGREREGKRERLCYNLGGKLSRILKIRHIPVETKLGKEAALPSLR